jgi:hypothetical protein
MNDMGASVKEIFEWSIIAATVTAGLIIGWVRVGVPLKEAVSSWWKGKTKKLYREQVTADKNIHEQLNKVRYDSDACRVKLLQFHNGGNFATGKSMKKISTTHESFHPGMAATVQSSSDQLLSLFSDMLELCHENEPILMNTSSLRDSYFKSYLQSNHVLMFSVLPVRNTKGEEIGCILCEWCAWAFADRVNSELFEEEFREARNSVEYMLSLEKKRSK